MPLPAPSSNESRTQWINRCMGDGKMNDEYPEEQQRYAVCNSIWDESKGKMMSQDLLAAIRGRKEKRTEFGYGILTADRWVKNMQDLAGLHACYSCAAKGSTSFDDVMKKAAQTLTYANPEMVVLEKGGLIPEEIQLPKNTLMVFRHVLTTPRKDRDGDILRTEGAELDPKMLLLWQHVHTLPIGKMLGITEHSKDQLELVSCIVDMNELSHDAAVMVDNDMARFSHGFRPLEWEGMKSKADEDGEEFTGFDIKRFEVMEESIVSVPSNTDAEQQEVLLSLVEGGKLTSSLMKEVGKTIRDHRNPQVAVTWYVTTDDTKQESEEIEEKEGEEDEIESRTGGDAPEGDGKGAEEPAVSPSEETEPVETETKEEDQAEDTEVTMEIEPEMVVATDPSEKSGRRLSAANLALLKDCLLDVEELLGKGEAAYGLTRGGIAVLERVHRKLSSLAEAAETSQEETAEITTTLEEKEIPVKEAIGIVIANASAVQRKKLIYILQTLNEQEERANRARKFRSLVRPK